MLQYGNQYEGCSLRLLYWMLGAIVFLMGCGGGGTYEQRATGKPGEVLVVSRYSLEGTPLGDTLRAYLEQEYPFLPQAERSLSLSFVAEKGFTPVLKSFRTILYLAEFPDSLVQEGVEGVQLRMEHDRWATPQRVIYLVGESMNALYQWISLHGEALYTLLHKEELARLRADYIQTYNKALHTAWYHKYGVRLYVPPSVGQRVEQDDFSWASLETQHISQGLIHYRCPLYGRESFCTDSVMAQRDYFTQKYIPGPTEGTYMVVSWVIPPQGTWLTRHGDSVLYVRGFWEVKGHAMGGPFVSYTYCTGRGDSLVTLGGYVYAPRFEKRNYVRELEAMLWLDTVPR